MDGSESTVERLRARGVLRSDATAAALGRLRPEQFVPSQLATFAHLDIPWPLPSKEFTLSPSLAVLLTELLEPAADERIFVPFRTPALVGALLGELEAVTDERPVDAFDKALLIDMDPASERKIRGLVKPEGFAIRLRLLTRGERLSKSVRSGGSWTDMGLNGLKLKGGVATVEHLLIAEGMERRVWLERRERPDEEKIAAIVDRTWAPSQAHWASMEGSGKELLLLAKKFFHLGHLNQAVGDLAKSVALYDASLQGMPTAEAHTFRAWSLGLMGKMEEAIDGCRKAIALDPDFGNPYNDIGAYLIEMGRPAESLEWFAKAKRAGRYDPVHFPYVNAGRAHLLMGQGDAARREFEEALKISPDYEPARQYLRRISG